LPGDSTKPEEAEEAGEAGEAGEAVGIVGEGHICGLDTELDERYSSFSSCTGIAGGELSANGDINTFKPSSGAFFGAGGVRSKEGAEDVGTG
tara:strand:+ start:316 stop:591 length:276 start_codon:yes stop_codon:yes gene_type:complete